MGLPALLQAVQGHLDSSLEPKPKQIGFGYPLSAAELPAITISVADVTERLRGIGRLPAPAMTGALRVETSLDLANPVLSSGDEEVQLLSDDGLTVQLVHGPLVRKDGTPGPGAWAKTDITVSRGATTFTPVLGPPAAADRVQVLPETGQLGFFAPLVGPGKLGLGYFVGEWEVRTARYQGTLSIETFAADLAGVDTLSAEVDAALEDARIAGLHGLSPRGWGPVAVNDTTRGDSRGRALTYRFDFELIEPRLATSGGLIATVGVDLYPDERTGPVTPMAEHFVVIGERS